MNVNNSFRRHVFKDLRPYVCTYEECAEGDQQYDDFRDWVGHEVNTHLGTEMRPSSPSEHSSEDHVLSLGSSKSPSQPRSSRLMAPNDTCRQICPIFLEENPTFDHVGNHLRRFAVFALPSLSGPDEDTILGDQGSNIANIDDRTSMSSQSTFEKLERISCVRIRKAIRMSRIQGPQEMLCLLERPPKKTSYTLDMLWTKWKVLLERGLT